MEVKDILNQLRDKLGGISMYGLSKRLGLKSTSHISMIMKDKRGVGLSTGRKIIFLAKKLGMDINLDDVCKEKIE